MKEANAIALFISNTKIETHKISLNLMTENLTLERGRFVRLWALKQKLSSPTSFFLNNPRMFPFISGGLRCSDSIQPSRALKTTRKAVSISEYLYLASVKKTACAHSLNCEHRGLHAMLLAKVPSITGQLLL